MQSPREIRELLGFTNSWEKMKIVAWQNESRSSRDRGKVAITYGSHHQIIMVPIWVAKEIDVAL